MQTSGDQINRKVNVPEVGNQFVHFFFQSLKEDVNKLYESQMIRNHTRIKYQNIEYKDIPLRVLLEEIKDKLIFYGEEIIVMDSGARRADILVNGFVISKNGNQKMKFAQYFTIANNHDNWFIHNSLLSII